MTSASNKDQAIELLQQLGLKEYEAKSFVALTRQQSGTAKDISETSEVPRTRVYDAIRVLENKGLVETQHSSPQKFRAVSIGEAVETLRSEYEKRAESLQTALQGLEPADRTEESSVTHEVWALSGDAGVTSRARELIENAEEEIVFVIGHDEIFTEELATQLRNAQDRGVNVVVGAVSEELRTTVEASLPESEAFLSGLEWLRSSAVPDDETEISRLLLVDREAILVSSFTEDDGQDRQHERAVFGEGFNNGLVAIVRRLMATGLLLDEDPGKAA